MFLALPAPAWQMPLVQVFNAWPQCTAGRATCNGQMKCLQSCSLVKGVILTDDRCPYGNWKPSRDIA